MSTAARYEIILHGRLDPSWSSRFDDTQFEVTPDGRTILTAEVADQAALHGLLARVRDLALELLSLRRLDETSDHFREETPSGTP